MAVNTQAGQLYGISGSKAYGYYKVYFRAANVTRSGTSVTITTANLYGLNASTTGYSTNKLWINNVYVGSTALGMKKGATTANVGSWVTGNVTKTITGVAATTTSLTVKWYGGSNGKAGQTGTCTLSLPAALEAPTVHYEKITDTTCEIDIMPSAGVSISGGSIQYGTSISYQWTGNVTSGGKCLLYGLTPGTTYYISATYIAGGSTSPATTSSFTTEGARILFDHQELGGASDSYISCESITGNGTSYIDTGYIAKPESRIECDFAFEDLTAQKIVFGAHTGDLQYKWYINGSGKFAWAFQNDTGNWFNTGVTADMSRRTFILDGYSGGNYVGCASLTPDVICKSFDTSHNKTATYSMYLFGAGGDAASINPTKGTMYSVRIYESGVLVRDYVPCIRLSDKVAGFFDKINNKFICGATPSAFTANSIRGLTKKTLSDGSQWVRVFYHNNKSSKCLFKEFKDCRNSKSTNVDSLLYILDDDKYRCKTDNKFEFMLEYPTDKAGKYNRWRQSNNPCNEFVTETSAGTGTAAGYEAVHIDWTSNHWGGLTRQNSDPTAKSNCYLSGSVGHVNWFYAIGAYAAHNGGIPAAADVTSNGATVNDVALWVRVDNTNAAGETTNINRSNHNAPCYTMIKVDGVWKKAKGIYIKVNGNWVLSNKRYRE